MMRMVVVLPAPLLPTKPVMRPPRTPKETSFSTGRPAKERSIEWSSNCAFMASTLRSPRVRHFPRRDGSGPPPYGGDERLLRRRAGNGEPVLVREHHRLHPVAHTEFGEQVRH